MEKLQLLMEKLEPVMQKLWNADTHVVVVVVGFATAAVGLLTAVFGRRKEIVHRHLKGNEIPRTSFLAAMFRGLMVLGIGSMVGAVAVHFYYSRASDPALGKLLSGPRSGKLTIKPPPNNFVQSDRSGLELRDCVLEVTFFAPAVPSKDITWQEGVYFRMSQSKNLSALVHSNGTWEVGGFGLEANGKWRTMQSGSLPTGLLAVNKGARNRIRVIIDGNKGKLFLNGSFVANFDTSELLEKGDVGPALYIAKDPSFQNDLEAYYEDFKVYALP